jgi:hypothetical protein
VKRMVTLVVMVTLLGAVALQPTALAGAETGRPDPIPSYEVESGSSSGGDYHLTSLAWQVCGTARGGGYHLVGPEAPALRGSGCCCTYLPMTLRNTW